MKFQRVVSIVCSLFSLTASATPLTTTTHETAASLGSGELIRVLTGLLAVVAVIVFLSWLLRRLNGAKLANSTALQVIACMNLGAREKIMLVNVGKRVLLVGVTTGSINTLHDFGEELPVGFSLDSKRSFAEFLKTALGKS
ncbi:flagellar biosynthetic protein FliO [Legionella fairfieldensis]|uniref:flagellar biosynthetic protein FliO n=1 Tax=Legionella fairfieldensis TaxID=45064 RepID=UPI00048FBCB9|nr:flagellar biosynthetic protein FliO [Legionella fairfieldensis]